MYNFLTKSYATYNYYSFYHPALLKRRCSIETVQLDSKNSILYATTMNLYKLQVLV